MDMPKSVSTGVFRHFTGPQSPGDRRCARSRRVHLGHRPHDEDAIGRDQAPRNSDGVLAGLRHLITLGHLGHHNGPPVSTVATTTQVTSGGT